MILSRLLQTEITKTVKNKTNYLYFVLLSIVGIGLLFGIELFDKSTSSYSGYDFFLFYLESISNSILPLILLLFSSVSISTEVASGTVRNVISLGYTRAEFLIAKIISCLFFLTSLMVFLAATGLILGSCFFGLGDIKEDGILLVTQKTFWLQFFFAYSLLSLVFFACCSLGLMISVICKNIVTAIISSLAVYFLIEILKVRIHLQDFVFSTYIEWPLSVLSELKEGFHVSFFPDAKKFLIVVILWIVSCLSIAFSVIKKHEYK